MHVNAWIIRIQLYQIKLYFADVLSAVTSLFTKAYSSLGMYLYLHLTNWSVEERIFTTEKALLPYVIMEKKLLSEYEIGLDSFKTNITGYKPKTLTLINMKPKFPLKTVKFEGFE